MVTLYMHPCIRCTDNHVYKSLHVLAIHNIPRPVASVYILPMSLLSMELCLSFQILMLLPQLIMALGSKNPASTSMAAANQLSLDYYARTRQNFEATVDRKIEHWVSRDYTLAASLIRLHFHGCAVRVIKLPPLLPVYLSHLKNSFNILFLSLIRGQCRDVTVPFC